MNRRPKDISRSHYSPPLYQLSYHGQQLLTHCSRCARCYQPILAGLNFIVTRGGLGLTIDPCNFQMTFHPTGQARVKIIKNSEITFFHVKMTVLFTSTLPANRALPKCKHAWPVRLCKSSSSSGSKRAGNNAQLAKLIIA